MQRDGNFVLYDSNGPKWATNTHTRCSGRCYIVYQQDGNLVVYTLNLFEGLRAIWASNTVRSNPGPLFLHNHGNLVMYTYMPANPLTTDDYENCYYNNYCGLSYSWQTKTHFQGQNLNRKRDASKTNKTDNANILLKFQQFSNYLLIQNIVYSTRIDYLRTEVLACRTEPCYI